MPNTRKRARGDGAGINPYGYDPDLPVLRGDPRLNPGLGLGTGWHPSQPVRNSWRDWGSANATLFSFHDKQWLPLDAGLPLIQDATAARLGGMSLERQRERWSQLRDPMHAGENTFQSDDVAVGDNRFNGIEGNADTWTPQDSRAQQQVQHRHQQPVMVVDDHGCSSSGYTQPKGGQASSTRSAAAASSSASFFAGLASRLDSMGPTLPLILPQQSAGVDTNGSSSGLLQPSTGTGGIGGGLIGLHISASTISLRSLGSSNGGSSAQSNSAVNSPAVLMPDWAALGLAHAFGPASQRMSSAVAAASGNDLLGAEGGAVKRRAATPSDAQLKQQQHQQHSQLYPSDDGRGGGVSPVAIAVNVHNGFGVGVNGAGIGASSSAYSTLLSPPIMGPSLVTTLPQAASFGAALATGQQQLTSSSLGISVPQSVSSSSWRTNQQLPQQSIGINQSVGHNISIVSRGHSAQFGPPSGGSPPADSSALCAAEVRPAGVSLSSSSLQVPSGAAVAMAVDGAPIAHAPAAAPAGPSSSSFSSTSAPPVLRTIADLAAALGSGATSVGGLSREDILHPLQPWNTALIAALAEAVQSKRAEEVEGRAAAAAAAAGEGAGRRGRSRQRRASASAAAGGGSASFAASGDVTMGDAGSRSSASGRQAGEDSGDELLDGHNVCPRHGIPLVRPPGTNASSGPPTICSACTSRAASRSRGRTASSRSQSRGAQHQQQPLSENRASSASGVSVAAPVAAAVLQPTAPTQLMVDAEPSQPRIEEEVGVRERLLQWLTSQGDCTCGCTSPPQLAGQHQHHPATCCDTGKQLLSSVPAAFSSSSSNAITAPLIAATNGSCRLASQLRQSLSAPAPMQSTP